MPAPSNPDLLVLLGLRLRSVATSEVLSTVTGLDPELVGSELAGLEADGRVTFREGALSGWMLTTAGRVEGERLLAAELDATGRRSDIEHAYRRFLEANQPLLEVCTQWQVRTVDGASVVNDHTDPVHDAAAVSRLAAIDAEVQPVLADLAEVLVRFGGYGPRLAGALAKVQGGDGDWFTRPTIDSYHSVWFELHENLLATLGIERSGEPLTPSEEAT